MKTLLLITFTTFLSASGINDEDLNDIYFQASLFAALFLSMYTISFFISRKHAKEYEKDNPPELVRLRKQAFREKHELALKTRQSELLELYKNKIINSKELKLMQDNLEDTVK